MNNKLIMLPAKGKAVFVGDTHGDVDASERVISEYLNKGYKIIFLGDYIDKSEKSRENVDYLLKTQEKNPDDIYLLLGNHEAYPIANCSPSDFWRSLNGMDYEYYSRRLSKLPLAAYCNGILALHAVPPDLKGINDINNIKDESKEWLAVTWGDFQDVDAGELPTPESGRPQFGQRYFERVMRELGCNVLIRSHQPHAAGVMFSKRCLTLFTSSSKKKRTIAIADLEKRIKTTDDLIMKEI